MDADERALMAAIIADPEEDTPRLIYADWLDEHGRPERAELIRAQIGLARTKDDDSATRQRAVWQARVRPLLAVHSERWRKELPSVPQCRWGAFERGMVESVTLKLRTGSDAVPARLNDLFGHAPLRIFRLHYTPWADPSPQYLAGLLGWDGLSRFDELRLATRFNAWQGEDPTGPFLAPLWTHPWADRPRLLDLCECVMPESALQPLLDSRPRTLPTLVLADRQFGGAIRAAITARLGAGVRFV